MIKLFYSQLLKQFPQIKHFFSTRIGGFSKKPFHWANMSLIAGDNFALKNRQTLSKQLGINLSQFVFMQHVHGDSVYIATESDAGKGAFNFISGIRQTDSLITATKGLMLVVTTADCVPILIYDRHNQVIAAVHSGWRGTVKKIVFKTLNLMAEKFDSKPQNIFAALGPSIGVCCYQVGQEVFDQFLDNFGAELSDKFFKKVTGQWYLDLWTANVLLLQDFGVPQNQIDIMGLCTACKNNDFFSARKGDRGRQLAGIMIKSSEY